ncbi:ABC transporter substrate-binding protein [Isoptericola dokdonensis]|uniref:ABC transporter substrate-binding protein n=1 Tax=Isoptericola dokdonensis TaxID=372663 RepID=UPI003002E130
MTAAKGIALAAVLGLGLTACASDDPAEETTSEATAAEGGDAEPLTIGTILPVTGTLAFLGPPEIAGVGLAVEDINEAGGVLGNDVSVEWGDSGDTTDTSVASSTATDLIGKGVSAVIGAASSGVSLAVVDTFEEAGVMQISPANTAADLSGYGPFFARTAPPDTVQGAALGSLVLDGGHTNVAMLVQNEAYGTGLRDHTQSAIEAGGGTVVYGANGEAQEFPRVRRTSVRRSPRHSPPSRTRSSSSPSRRRSRSSTSSSPRAGSSTAPRTSATATCRTTATSSTRAPSPASRAPCRAPRPTTPSRSA